MMPFLYPTPATAFPMLVIASQSHLEHDDDDDDDDEDIEGGYLSTLSNVFSSTMPFPMTASSHFVNLDGQIPPLPPAPPSTHHDDSSKFHLRINVDGFQPHELHISIRQGRVIVRGKHIVRTQSQASSPLTTNSVINGNDDSEPDFDAKEFKRTFTIPPNTDIRKAHAQFYPQQQLLLIEIPFQNSTDSSPTTTTTRSRIRPMDIFLTIITILLMDRALRITYEQFMMNEQSRTDPSTSHYRNRRRANHDIIF